MKRIQTWFIALIAIASGLNLSAQNNQREMRFYTQPAIFAANEEWLTFACEVPDGQVDIGSQRQSEMYWYSLYNLGNLKLRSGLGIHAINNPLFAKHAREDKDMPWSKGPMIMRERTFMLHKIAQFKAATGAYKLDNMFAGLNPPKGAFPIYLEFASGVPEFQTNPDLEDFATLRWNKKTFDATLSPGAWGQSLMKEVLWSRDFFHGNRTSNGVTYLGVSAFDGAHGFRGAMLLAMSLTKTYALKSELAYHAKTGKLGEVNPMTYDPMQGAVYYPHAYKAKYKKGMMMGMMKMMMKMKGQTIPPIVKKYVVTDKSSYLFDVASLLWGESEFYYVTDPKVKDNFDKLFGDAMWDPTTLDDKGIGAALNSGKTIFPAGKPHMLAQGISVVNFKNLKALHFNSKNGTFVDRWHPDEGQGNYITTANAGMAIIALSNTYFRLSDIEKIHQGAKMLLTAQANFLLKQQNSDGSIANGFALDNGIKADKAANSALSQSFAIRGWLAAYQVSKDQKFLDAADKAYNYMQNELWSEEAGVYRSEAGAQQSTYTGMNYGAILGALRELAIAHNGEASQQQIVQRLDTFFDHVQNVNGLQLAELGQTGEMMPDKQQMTMMQEKLAELQKSNPEKAKKMMARMQDSDGDHVPKPKFVMNTEYGAAPVTAGSIVIATPGAVYTK